MNTPKVTNETLPTEAEAAIIAKRILAKGNGPLPATIHGAGQGAAGLQAAREVAKAPAPANRKARRAAKGVAKAKAPGKGKAPGKAKARGTGVRRFAVAPDFDNSDTVTILKRGACGAGFKNGRTVQETTKARRALGGKGNRSAVRNAWRNGWISLTKANGKVRKAPAARK